jgi:pimeloyl-ACP methyl ester carboxylesterase
VWRGVVLFVGALGLLLAVAAAAPAADRPNAVESPVRVVRVPWGVVGYRVVGQGRPLVLLNGLEESLDDWPPTLLDDLGRHERVYAIDYEGVGRSSLDRPVAQGATRVTIPRLADDAAAFIHALHLGRVDVMGWSLGSGVAQALAIRHPTLVRRLVLAATALGDGRARIATDARPVGYQCSVDYGGMFPYTVKGCAAAIAYDRAIHTYPDFAKEQVSILAYTYEHRDAGDWLSGAYADGHLAARIKVPVLIGTGADDVLRAASAQAARTMPDATLKVYPDAGHGFLFQYAADWSRRVLQFLETA